jgi:uncharacterized repeat protein (TIGR01451 family)
MLTEGQALPGLEIELVNATDSSEVFNGVEEVFLQVFGTTEFFFTVTDPVTGNSCWGIVTIFSAACSDTMYVSFTNDVGIDEIIIDVVLEESQTLASIQWSNIYDGNIMQFDEVIPAALNVSNISFNEIEPGLLNMAWFAPADILVNGDQVLFSLKFSVLDNGDTDFGIAPSGVGIPTEITSLVDGFICLEYESGQITSNGAKVQGTIERNDDLGCTSNNPSPLQDWVVRISNASETYFTTTDEDGSYKRVVLPGDYTVTAFPYSNMWGFCENDIAISLPAIGDEATADFTGVATSSCPFMEVNISTPFLRRCFSNTYHIEYCNYGTLEATDAYIEVELDDFLTITDASVPFTQDGQLITFELGTVGLECGNISFEVIVDCDAELGQTHCVVATIFPQDPCGEALLGWTGPVIEVEAICENDEVTFIVENTGIENMITTADFIVVEDDVMTQAGDFILDALEATEFKFPSNGATYRLNADQPSGFPFNEFATAFVEGCGTDENGEFSTGFANNFGSSDYQPYMDYDCQENIGSYDPNDKASFPEGYGEEHYVKNNQPIDYKIRFQNTGTDTAFRVVIIDTLSSLLDLSTFRRTTYSHRNDVTLVDNVVTFTFNNILLVDSTANEPASHGYVSFQIDMLPDLADGNLIENNADIYFDFNDPIRTNTTFLEIGTDFIEDASVSTIDNPFDININIYPNPARANSTISFEGHDFSDLRLEVSNIVGKRVANKNLKSNQVDLSEMALVKGTYLMRLVHDSKLVYTGKLIVH